MDTELKLLAELTEIQIRLGKTDEARKRLEARLAKDASDPVAHKLLGMVALAEKKPDLAEAEFRKHVEIAPQDPVGWLQLAGLAARKGDYDAAVGYYDRGLEQAPGDLRLMLGKATALERKGDYDGAIAVYEQVLEQQPDNALATNNLAALLADHRTDAESLARAKELAGKFENTNQAVFLDTLGWVHYRAGEYDEAVKVLKRVVEAAPQVAVFHYHLGMAAAKAGDKALAKEHLAKALELGEFAGRDEARATLESL